MKIAFISYEAPPDTLVGGIGTYVGQAAAALASIGHSVEVFAGSSISSEPLTSSGYLTHRLRIDGTFEDRLRFPLLAGRLFAERHFRAPFDVLEGPEFLAEAAEAKRLVPSVPLVLKLHMSMSLIREINRPPTSSFRKLWNRAKGVLQPMLQLRRWREFDFAALELPHLLEADVISAPCQAIADITARRWKLDRSQMTEVPYPFTPSPQLLTIPAETNTMTVGYVGRLEQRKGVIDLAKAIPEIAERFPHVRFTFAGASERSPIAGVSMEAFLAERLKGFRDRVSFLGRVAPEKMAAVFSQMDICVLPSIWENFPNACLEAMSAARGVVGSSAGGMAQQLDAGRAGLLVAPGDYRQIAAAVCELLSNPDRRVELGKRARARVLAEYNVPKIGRLMEDSYYAAIQQKRTGRRKWQVQ